MVPAQFRKIRPAIPWQAPEGRPFGRSWRCRDGPSAPILRADPPPLQPRYDAPTLSTRKWADCSRPRGKNLCTGERIESRRDERLTTPANNWNFMDLLGAPRLSLLARPPVERDSRPPKRSASQSLQCAGVLVSRAAFEPKLRWVKSADRGAALEFNMVSITYRCPTTGQKVESWLADEAPGGDRTYVVLRCSACDGVHLINRSAAGTRDGDSSPPSRMC